MPRRVSWITRGAGSESAGAMGAIFGGFHGLPGVRVPGGVTGRILTAGCGWQSPERGLAETPETNGPACQRNVGCHREPHPLFRNVLPHGDGWWVFSAGSVNFCVDCIRRRMFAAVCRICHKTRFAIRAVIFERRYSYPFGQAVFKFRFARAATFFAIISAWPLLRWVSAKILNFFMRQIPCSTPMRSFACHVL